MKTINPNEIAIGDSVLVRPSPTSSGYSGKVHKAARVNIHVMSKYQLGHTGDPNNPPIDLDLGARRRTEIEFVQRGNEVFQVTT